MNTVRHHLPRLIASLAVVVALQGAAGLALTSAVQAASPTISAYGHYGEVHVSGTAFTASGGVSLHIYDTVTHVYWVNKTITASSSGAITYTAIAPGACNDDPLNVHAYDKTTGVWSNIVHNVVAGCIA